VEQNHASECSIESVYTARNPEIAENRKNNDSSIPTSKDESGKIPHDLISFEQKVKNRGPQIKDIGRCEENGLTPKVTAITSPSDRTSRKEPREYPLFRTDELYEDPDIEDKHTLVDLAATRIAKHFRLPFMKNIFYKITSMCGEKTVEIHRKRIPNAYSTL
jgi:hypothetical protein